MGICGEQEEWNLRRGARNIESQGKWLLSYSQMAIRDIYTVSAATRGRPESEADLVEG